MLIKPNIPTTGLLCLSLHSTHTHIYIYIYTSICFWLELLSIDISHKNCNCRTCIYISLQSIYVMQRYVIISTCQYSWGYCIKNMDISKYDSSWQAIDTALNDDWLSRIPRFENLGLIHTYKWYQLWTINCISSNTVLKPFGKPIGLSADSSFAPSQCETELLCNDVSHWPDVSLESQHG